MTTLADLTTLRMGGPIAEHMRVSTIDALVDAAAAADATGGPLPVVDGGSNLLASDTPSEDTAVDMQPFDKVASVIHENPASSVVVHAGAGTVWDAFISWTLFKGLCDPEALSGIPGTVNVSPVQNVDAHGHEVSETIESAEAYDHLTGTVVCLFLSDFSFAYRSSATKHSVGESGPGDRPWGPTGRWMILSVDFRLVHSPLSVPVIYTELARRLGVETGERADASLARPIVLDLHRGRGMALDAENHSTWSASSFFMNSILSKAMTASLPEDAPCFSAGEGLFKTSVAWLIDRTGCSKSFHPPKAEDPSYTLLSTRHVLVLTNRGGMTGADIEALARAVHEQVFGAFDVILVSEPVTIDITWQRD